MNSYFRTTPGKSILFILCIAAIWMTISSIVAAGIMIGGEFYTHTEQEIFKRLSFSSIRGEIRTILDAHTLYLEEHVGKSRGALPFIADSKNLTFEVIDNGNVLIRSANVEHGTPWEYYFGLLHESDREKLPFEAEHRFPVYTFHTIPAGTNNRLVMRVALQDGLPHTDRIALIFAFVRTMYALRYWVYPIGILSALTVLATFIALMNVSGRRKGSDALHPGPLHKIPFDLMLGAEALLFAAILAVFAHEAGSTRYEMIATAMLAVMLIGIPLPSVFLGMCMSAAVRIKQGTFLRNNLIVILPRMLWRAIIAIFRSFCRAFTSIKPTPRITVILLALAALDFFLTVSTYRSNFFGFWCFKTLFLLLLAAYLIMSMRRIRKAGAALASGDLSYQMDTRGLHLDFHDHAHDLNSIARGMANAVEERLKSERMKTELITNVSHDIKTPLTSIINYSGLIHEASTAAEPQTPQIKEYSEVLMRQSGKLKALIDDLVEASKASTGNLELALAPADAALYLNQISGEYADRLAKAGLTPVMRNACEENEHFILADSRRMWRVFDNVMNNICKYSLHGTRVYLDLEATRDKVIFQFKNTSRDPLNISADELFERFTRGDRSRHTEGSGLGLSIAKSLVELQGGTMEIQIDGDLFKTTISFPKV